MNTVGEILQTKGHQVWSVTPDTSVFEALELMAEKQIGAVLVIENERVIGVFSERDYARKVILKGRSSHTTLVSELMTRKIVYVSPEDKVDECMALMTAKRVRHLPVLENHTLLGIVTIGDVVKAIISHQENTIRELEKYITGVY